MWLPLITVSEASIQEDGIFGTDSLPKILHETT